MPWFSVMNIILIVVLILHTTMAEQEAVLENDIDTTDPETLKVLEKSLLTSMGLERKPKVNRTRVHIPPYMQQLFNIQNQQNLGTVEDENLHRIPPVDPDVVFSTVRSYTHQEPEEDVVSADTIVLHFNTTQLPNNEVVQAVNLIIAHDSSYVGLYSDYNITKSFSRETKWTSNDVQYLQRLRVYDIVRPSADGNAVHRLLDTKVVDSRSSGTINLDVAPAVHRWLKKPHTNNGLFFEVLPLRPELTFLKTKHSIRIRRAIGQREAAWADEQPLLVIHSDDGTGKRQKRSSDNYHNKYRQYCQRYKLTIDFKKVEWTDWIVAPAGYDAYFCYGACSFPLTDKMNATNHAVVQTLLNSRYPSRVPPACCVPTVHRAISMLYVDEDERVVLKNYQDMIVEACGCR